MIYNYIYKDIDIISDRNTGGGTLKIDGLFESNLKYLKCLIGVPPGCSLVSKPFLSMPFLSEI